MKNYTELVEKFNDRHKKNKIVLTKREDFKEIVDICKEEIGYTTAELGIAITNTILKNTSS